MSRPYDPPADYAVCLNCRGPIPEKRRGSYHDCTRSCLMARLGLWEGFNPGNASDVTLACARLMARYRAQHHSGRMN